MTLEMKIPVPTPLIQEGLSRYRQILRTWNKIIQVNESPERSHTLQGVVPFDQITSYIKNQVRKEYTLSKRRFASQKIDESAIKDMHKNMKWIDYGLRVALSHIEHPSNKRKMVRQSPYFSLLSVVSEGYGNNYFQSTAVEKFIDIAKYEATYMTLPKPPARWTNKREQVLEKLKAERLEGDRQKQLQQAKSALDDKKRRAAEEKAQQKASKIALKNPTARNSALKKKHF
ncbi:hypothetical protein AKO1_014064 [Acrasis kona]|uniref:Uncharacterized protein n=1 Tax=Acrasis kona TaxID=1008807 RepID=A0AAW2Z403_9EUKA